MHAEHPHVVPGTLNLRSLHRALALLWTTHRGYTLLLVALTALGGLLAPLQLGVGRLLKVPRTRGSDAVARFLPIAPAARAEVGGLLFLVGAAAGVSLLGRLKAGVREAFVWPVSVTVVAGTGHRRDPLAVYAGSVRPRTHRFLQEALHTGEYEPQACSMTIYIRTPGAINHEPIDICSAAA